jgi:ribosomal-protein-alanine N-acetyltransferase
VKTKLKSQAFLIGSSVYLRPLEENDAFGNYGNWFNDAEICQGNSHHVFPFLQDKAVEYIQYARRTKDSLILAIVTVTDNEHIGNISLQDIHSIHRTAEFAIVLGEKQHWNKGFSKEAARLIIEHGFAALNLNRISCGTFQTNISMHKLAESLGFRKEGIRRSAVYKNNHYLDVYEYGILKEEWFKHSI